MFAYCDVLGQKEELWKLRDVPHTPERLADAMQILKRTSGRVLMVRKLLNDYFRTAEKTNLTHLDRLTSEARAEYLRMRRLRFRTVGFSDSFVVASSLASVEEFGPAPAAIAAWTTLWGLAAMMLTALSVGIPLRAGIDVERGVGMFSDEVYGLGLLCAYELESKKAKYPRAALGEGLLEYLDFLARQDDTDKWQRGARLTAPHLRNLVFQTEDGPMLHMLSPEVIDAEAPSTPDLRKAARAAYAWVSGERDRFEKADNQRLAEKYERLVRYFNDNGYPK